MHASPEAAVVRAWLERAARRAMALAAARGAALGLLVSALLVIAGAYGRSRSLTVGVSAALLVAGAAAGIALSRRRRIPQEIERSNPDSRNLILTADELLRELVR